MRSRFVYPILLGGWLGLFGAEAPAQTTFNFLLQGSQQVSTVFTAARGHCTAVLNQAETELQLTCTHNVENTTAAHIHNAAAGVGGPVIFPLDHTVNPIVATWDQNSTPPFAAEHAAALQAGELYVNVHSSAYPGGEIRGQIQNAETTFRFALRAVEENPPTASSATGQCTAVLNQGHTMLDVDCTHNLVPTAAHIHQAGPGANGSVILPFTGPSSPLDQVFEVTPEQVQALMAGDTYVNVHSSAFQGGEVRGQILPDDVVQTLLPQAGAGPGLVTIISLTNPFASRTVSGAAVFRDDLGVPVKLPVLQENGSAVLRSHVAFSLPPLGGAVIELSGGEDLVDASVTLLSSDRVGATAFFELENLGEAGVGPSPPARGLIFPVRDATTLGVAIQGVPNPGLEERALELTLTLRDGLGQTVASALIPDFPSRGHRADFVSEYFAGMELNGFEGGTLTLEVTGVEGEGGQMGNAGGRIAARAIIVGSGTGEISAPPATPLEPE